MNSNAGEMPSYSIIKAHYELYASCCHAMLSIRNEDGLLACNIVFFVLSEDKEECLSTNQREITGQLSYISCYSITSSIWNWLTDISLLVPDT